MTPQVSYYLVCGIVFFGGLFIGRFLNRCIDRLPDEFYVIPAWKKVFSVEQRRGHYPATKWYHRLPVIGTATIVGRSPYSGRRIRPREPWLELLNGLMLLGTFCWFCPHAAWETNQILTANDYFRGFPGWEVSQRVMLLARFVYFALLFEFLFVATFIDFDLWIIPDGVTLPGMIVGVVGQVLGLTFCLAPLWVQDPGLIEVLPMFDWWPVEGDIPQWVFEYPFLHAFAISLAGFLVGGGIVWIVRIVGELVLKKEAMGFGDVILMAMIGTFIGWQPVVVVFFMAPLIALVVIAITTILRTFSIWNFPAELPYGPYLSLATILVVFFWHSHLWDRLGRFFELGPILILFAGLMIIFLIGTLLLLQLLKWMVGIQPWPEEYGDWRSADQLLFFMGNKLDRQPSDWKQSQWNGVSASRGKLHEHQWRNDCHN